MKKLRLFLCFAIIISCLLGFCASATEQSGPYPVAFPIFEDWANAESTAALTGNLGCKSALLMEAGTGKVLYSDNEEEHLPIASVTKIMTTLLVAEAIDNGKIALEDPVTVSAYAASMGGSQVYLEPGEQMSVHELLKCLVVVSANDAAVALAEHILGSAESFVVSMNEHASALGMENTSFTNVTGLDNGGYSCALDVALMTRELLKHPLIFDYTTIWMDTVRNGAFGLSNTNRLIRFYKGANGMKTGFTSEAMYCVSATAKRDGMQLIAVVLGAPASDERFAAAKKMLDFGFANYRAVKPAAPELEDMPVKGGTGKSVALEAEMPSLLTEKGAAEPQCVLKLPDSVRAPVSKGQIIGHLTVVQGETELCSIPVKAAADVPAMNFFGMLKYIWKNILSFV